MPSSTPRKPRVSRNGDIPDSLIMKWQSSGPKPLVRRPVTACQACRAAKVKCGNQPRCDRCTSRNIVCRYTNAAGALDTPPPSNPSSTNDAASPRAHTQTTPAESPIDLPTPDATHRLSTGGNTGYDDTLDFMPDWAPDPGHQALDDFAWPPPMDTSLNAAAFSTNAPAATPLFQTNDGSMATMMATNEFLQPNQLFSLPKCQCRESLVMLVPRVNTAMQGQQLDKVFKGMQRVVEGFLEIVHCLHCDITCVDLVCIMSVFQQTGPGFEYIAKADLGSAITMSFGGSEVPIINPQLRAMLVTSLIDQATAVLDAIGAKGQHMLRSLSTPSPIALANIGHLDTVIGDFRNVLRRMADTAAETASSPTQSSSTLSTQTGPDPDLSSWTS